MLTILTSPHIEIHEQTMLLPIKTCYNIQISSKSLINQASARAALTQIINTVLQRLEQSAAARREQERLEQLALLERQQQQQQLQQQQQVQQKRQQNADDEALSLHNGNDQIQQHQQSNQHANSSEHYREMYMDMLRHFECEQLHMSGVRSDSIAIDSQSNSSSTSTSNSGDQQESGEVLASSISELMCHMLEAICDDDDEEEAIDETLSLNGVAGAGAGSGTGGIHELSFRSDDTSNSSTSASASSSAKLTTSSGVDSTNGTAADVQLPAKPAAVVVAARDPELIGKNSNY